MLIYGGTNVGKTTSILASCDLPAEYAQIEKRGLMRNIQVANQIRQQNGLPLITNDNFTIYLYDNYEAFKDHYAKPRKSYPKTVILDSITHLMEIHFMTETEDEAHISRLEDLLAEATKNKKAGVHSIDDVGLTKNIASQNKQTQEGYGVISSATKRITGIFGNWAAEGCQVVFIALEDERTKLINGKVQRVPLFSGKDYMKSAPGCFDLIGRVVKRIDKDSKQTIYPPAVYFDSPADDFLAKWTGVGDKRVFPLDLQVINSSGDIDKVAEAKK